MDLMDLLVKNGGGDSVRQIAGSIGIGDSEAKDLIGALGPALTRGLQKQTESNNGLEALSRALSSGNHRQYLERPDLMQSASTRDDGNKILGHLFGSKDVSRNVAAQASSDTGIDAGLIKKALPLVASLAMGALSKDPQGGSRGGLGSLVGGLLGGGSSSADDLLSLAKKLF